MIDPIGGKDTDPEERERVKVKTTVRVPHQLKRMVREHADRHGVTNTEVVLDAYLAKRTAIMQRYSSPADMERRKLGLAPAGRRALFDYKKDSAQLGLYLRPVAGRMLAEKAAQLNMSRRRYICELLYLYLYTDPPV